MEKKLLFTVNEAKEYAQRGLLEEWVHEFLLTVGNNPEFSEGLRLQKRYWAGPFELKFDFIERCCGPEESMEYRIDAGIFYNYVGEMAKSLQNGWEPPPLIVQYVKGVLSLRDGNHRYEALKKCGYDSYCVILWFAGQEDYEKGIADFKERYGIEIRDNKEEYV